MSQRTKWTAGTATMVASIMAALLFYFTPPAAAGSQKGGIQDYIERHSENIPCTRRRGAEWQECEGRSISYEQVPNGLNNYGTCVSTAAANFVVNPPASCQAPADGLVGYFSGRLAQDSKNGVQLTHLHDALEDLAADDILCPGLDWDWSKSVNGPKDQESAARAILGKMQLQPHQTKKTAHVNSVIASLVHGRDRHAIVIADYSYDGSLTEGCFFQFLTWGQKKRMPCLKLARIVKGRFIYRGDDE